MTMKKAYVKFKDAMGKHTLTGVAAKDYGEMLVKNNKLERAIMILKEALHIHSRDDGVQALTLFSIVDKIIDTINMHYKENIDERTKMYVSMHRDIEYCAYNLSKRDKLDHYESSLLWHKVGEI